MTVSEWVQHVLIANAALIAAVPAARIRVPGSWQNLTLPYIVHFPVSCDIDRAHDGAIPLKIWQYQISVFAASFEDAEAAALLARTAIDTTHDEVTAWPETLRYVGLEDETGVHHYVVECRVAEAL